MDKNAEGTFYVNAGGSQNPTGFITCTGTGDQTAGTTGGSFRVYYKMDISHTHEFSSDSEGGNECRPNNYTIRVWKRTA